MMATCCTCSCSILCKIVRIIHLFFENVEERVIAKNAQYRFMFNFLFNAFLNLLFKNGSSSRSVQYFILKYELQILEVFQNLKYLEMISKFSAHICSRRVQKVVRLQNIRSGKIVAPKLKGSTYFEPPSIYNNFEPQ